MTYPRVAWLIPDTDGVAEVPDLDEHDLIVVVPPVVSDVNSWVIGRVTWKECRLVHYDCDLLWSV